jgi:hypothetical protein
VDSGPDSDEQSSMTLFDTSAAEPGSASPTEPSHPAEGDPPPDDATDPEQDEAIDDEFHDLALAAETSGISAHGHEVTSPPSNDDQSETLRIVTEAVELGEAGPPSAPSPSAEEPTKTVPSRPAPSSPRPKRSQAKPEAPADEVS